MIDSYKHKIVVFLRVVNRMRNDFRDVRIPSQIASDFDEIRAVRKCLVSVFKRREFCQNPTGSDRVHIMNRAAQYGCT